MSTHIEAEAVVRRMEKYGEPFAAPIVAFWREHMQPAVPSPPDGPHLPDHPARLVPPRRDRDVTATGRAVAALLGDGRE